MLSLKKMGSSKWQLRDLWKSHAMVTMLILADCNFSAVIGTEYMKILSRRIFRIFYATKYCLKVNTVAKATYRVTEKQISFQSCT